MLQAKDPRLMTAQELDDYANEFQSNMSEGLYDTEKVDFNSPYFKALPEATQYQLLTAARLRSRLRMGYTKEELEQKFPDRLDFSKFQVNRVAQRNFLTQKLMGMVGFETDGTLGDPASGTPRGRRVAGDKNNAYVLQKNVNGWTLSLDKNKDQVIKIDVDETEVRPEDRVQVKKEETDDEESEEDWEDVPIAPENPATPQPAELPSSLRGFGDEIQRQQLYDRLRQQSEKPQTTTTTKDNFFIIDDDEGSDSHVDSRTAVNKNTNKNAMSDDFGDLGASIFSKKKDTAAAVGQQASKTPSETSAGKAPEVLPPWFSKPDAAHVNQKETEQDAGSANADDQLISVEQLQNERRVTNFYASDDEIEMQTTPSRDSGKADNPFVIDSDTSDGEPEISSPKAVAASESEGKITSGPLEELPVSQPSETVEQISQAAPTDMTEYQGDLKDSAKEQELTVNTVNTAVASPTDTAIAGTEDAPEPRSESSPAAPFVPKYSEDHETELADEELRLQQEEDEELAELLEKEEESNLLFAQELSLMEHNSTISGPSSAAPPMQPAVKPVSLKTSNEYDVEINQLKKQAQKEQRDSDEVTQAMIEECQELLRRFGIPYITAPMEAEAQCATLQDLGLVDGIVTDDGDCFLFGGRRVFKNMFANANKYVECYDMNDLEREFGLDRAKMIKLALLLGSDYTEGVTGVGPVTAMEILAEFDTPEGLTQFRDWWESVQLKSSTEPAESMSDFKKRFKRNATKIFLPANFPQPEVTEAYLHPEVDADPTPFEWGAPDLDAIRTYMDAMAGWDFAATEKVLVPVLQNLNGRIQEEKQKTLGDFFLFTKKDGSGPAPAPGAEVGKSKRLTKALEKMGQRHKRKLDGSASAPAAAEESAPKKKSKKAKGKTVSTATE